MLAGVSSRCEQAFGAMGSTGFLYDSVKDQLRWRKLRVKSYVGLIMQVGRLVVLKDEDYSKAKVKSVEMDHSDMSHALISAFGDGK